MLAFGNQEVRIEKKTLFVRCGSGWVTKIMGVGVPRPSKVQQQQQPYNA